jgi:hypothetical protein
VAAGLTAEIERRGGARVTPDQTRWRRLALLRPGQEVAVVNLGPGGALLESANRMKPGARTELQLFGEVRWQVRGRIDRCRVLRLAPLCYEAAIVFEEPLDLAEQGG